MELEATREALAEEGEEKARALQGELQGVKGELARAQVGGLMCVGLVIAGVCAHPCVCGWVGGGKCVAPHPPVLIY